MAIDFYNNYMTNFHDNPFETDGGMHNVRILRNLMINSASHAFCNQPTRRADLLDQEHRLSSAGRIHAAANGSTGVLFYNNTILAETTATAIEHALAQ